MDWLDSYNRIQQGRTSDPSQDAIDAPLSLGQYFLQSLRNDARNIPIIGSAFDPPEKQKPIPTEGVDSIPFGSISDPISQVAFLLAPYLKGGMSKGLSSLQGNTTYKPGMFSGERGSLSDEFKNAMGNRITDTPRTVRTGQTPKDMQALESKWLAINKAKAVQEDAINKLVEAFPQHDHYIQYALKKGVKTENIARTLADPNTRNKLEVAYRLSDTSTSNTPRLDNFIKTHIDPDSEGYILNDNKGSFLSDRGVGKLFDNITKPYIAAEPLSIQELQQKFPEDAYFIKKGADKGIDSNTILKTLADPETRNKLDTAYRLMDKPTQEPDRMLNFTKTHIDPTIKDLDQIRNKQYIFDMYKGVNDTSKHLGNAVIANDELHNSFLASDVSNKHIGTILGDDALDGLIANIFKPYLKE